MQGCSACLPCDTKLTDNASGECPECRYGKMLIIGLDVYLYRFPGMNAQAIVRLARALEEIGDAVVRDREALGWREGMPWPSPEIRAHLKALAEPIAKALGSPGWQYETIHSVGHQVNLPSSRHPDSPLRIGDWEAGFSGIWDALTAATGRRVEIAFPDAHEGWYRPNWRYARAGLLDLLSQVQHIGVAGLVEPWGEFASEQYGHSIEALEVMIQTIDYVLAQPNPDEFLLDWSA